MKNSTRIIIVVAIFLTGAFLSSCQKDFIDQKETEVQTINSSHSFKGAIEYCGEQSTIDLLADQDVDVGSVTIGNDDTQLIITITITPDWYMTNVKIWVGTDMDDLPVNKSGNPVRGKFTINKNFNPSSISSTYFFPFGDIGDGTDFGSSIIVAVHADVEMEYFDDDILLVREETAWGYGTPIGGKSWGWYSEYEILECDWECGDPIFDADENPYNTVSIGDQCWMAQNLAYLPEVSPPSTGSDQEPYYYVYAYNGSDESTASGTSNYSKYGVLYNWPAANDNVCPSGWHLPTDTEWTQLADYLETNGFGYGGSGSDIGKSMAATSGWNLSNNEGAVGNDQGSNNSSGFGALPGGYRAPPDVFFAEGWSGYYWSSTQYNSEAGAWHHFNNGDGFYPNQLQRSHGFSVRCVKD